MLTHVCSFVSAIIIDKKAHTHLTWFQYHLPSLSTFHHYYYNLVAPWRCRYCRLCYTPNTTAPLIARHHVFSAKLVLTYFCDLICCCCCYLCVYFFRLVSSIFLFFSVYFTYTSRRRLCIYLFIIELFMFSYVFGGL